MSQEIHQTEAIILRVIPFREYDQILTLFTLDAGVIKVIRKGNRYKQRGGLGIALPLTKVEVLYIEKRGEIFVCHDMTLLDSFAHLRQEFLCLEVGCDLLHIILESQLLGKWAPSLYVLLNAYLTKIRITQDPEILGASFRLKLLNYEGLISFPFKCMECGVLLAEEAYTWGAESWCKIHQCNGSLAWKEEELQPLYRLANSQSYREISSVVISKELKDKIRLFFEMCIKR